MSNYLTMKNIFLVLLLLFLVWPQAAAASVLENKVKINILSKQIKLLQEGALESISISAPEEATIRVESALINTAIKMPLKIVRKEQALKILTADGQEIVGSFVISIESGLKDQECTASFGAEKRVYALPLLIKSDNNAWKIITEEEIGRYAADAARAEYGNLNEAQHEAWAALMLLIIAHSEQVKNLPVHDGHDFCDLTHCQVFYGHSKEINNIKADIPWLIDAAKLSMLPFNSNCGGLILGNSVFGNAKDSNEIMKDWIVSENQYLCSLPNSEWERTLSPKDIIRIMLGEDKFDRSKSFSLKQEKLALPLEINYGGIIYYFAPEDFRLKINRVYGWNFIRSNNYKIMIKTNDGKKYYVFRGTGLGHGVGLCQHGALKLAEMGYSRYEILHHYFPKLNFRQNPNFAEKNIYHSDLSYVVFSLVTGKAVTTSYNNFSSRKIPAGSIFKLITSLYLASEDSDLMNNHRFFCRKSQDTNMPDKCWHPEGHGDVDFSAALTNSCNLYFSSLYRHLNKDKFSSYWHNLNNDLLWNVPLPPIKADKEFSYLLAGLNFRVKLSVSELMQLTKILSAIQTESVSVEKMKANIPQKNRDTIYSALIDVVLSGTASDEGRIVVKDKKEDKVSLDSKPYGSIWGKTSTVVDGTNKSLSYGIFLGGCKDLGIVAIIRNSNGHLTARQAIKILQGAVSAY